MSSKSLPSIGDTAWLAFHYTASYSGPANLHFDFPGAVVPFNQAPGETERDSAITVDSGVVYNDSIPFKLSAYGASMLQFNVSADSMTSSAHQMASAASDYFEFEFSSTSFQVFSDDFQQNGLDSAMDEEVTPGGATMNISGTVTYKDIDQFNASKGVYGAYVIMLFQRSGQDGSFANPYTGEINGILHTAKIDVNGNFSFSFTGPVDWSAFQNVILLVATANDAVFNLQTPSGQAIAIAFDSLFGRPMYGQIGTFTRAEGKTLAVNDIHNINYTNVAINVNSVDGAILRDMELSWEFEHARGVAQPGAITVVRENLGGVDAGLFHLIYEFLEPNYSYISIDPKGNPYFATVAHEYGHYQNYYNMGPVTSSDWNDGYSNDPSFYEGWAEFHQFAVRNYAASTYGEYSPWWDDNQEGDNSFGCSGPFSANPRFAGIRYQGSTAAPNAAAFSCVLWNVYDQATDQSFRAPQYQGKDNDDVGLPNRVFDIIAGWNDEISIGDYMAALFTASPSETPSIYHIYANMLVDVDTPMVPAQVENLSGSFEHHPDEWEINWDYSKEYGSVCYQNPPEGIHVYQWDGTYQGDGSKTWVLIATASYPATYARFAYNSSYQNWFEAASYNASGDAENPQSINPPASKIATGHFGADTASIELNVHPNPAGNLTHICVTDLPEGFPVTMIIVNSAGQVVSTLYNATPEAELGLCCTLDCSKLPNGTYFARLWNDFLGQSVKISIQH